MVNADFRVTAAWPQAGISDAWFAWTQREDILHQIAALYDGFSFPAEDAWRAMTSSTSRIPTDSKRKNGSHNRAPDLELANPLCNRRFS